MSTDATLSKTIRGGNFSLWIGMLGGPAAWLCQLQLSYMLVPWACKTGHHLPLHLSGILFGLCAAGIAWFTWRNLLVLIAKQGEAEAGLARGHFMAVVGLMMSVLFTLLIFVQTAAAFIIGPCPD